MSSSSLLGRAQTMEQYKVHRVDVDKLIAPVITKEDWGVYE